jgi:hypothetical protein
MVALSLLLSVANSAVASFAMCLLVFASRLYHAAPLYWIWLQHLAYTATCTCSHAHQLGQ